MAVSRGKSDLAAALAKQPPAKKAAILGGVLVVLGLLYYQFFYSGLTETKASAVTTKKRLIKEQDSLEKDKKKLDKLDAEYKELEKGIKSIQLALPTEAELPSFIDHLQVKAGDSGVNFKSWDRMKEQPIEKYFKVPMQVVVSGKLYQLMHYFHLLGPAKVDPGRKKAEEESGIADRRPAERIVTIENLRLGEAEVQNEEILLTARFMASTFRQEETKKPPPKKKADKDAKGEGKKKGGKGQVKDAKKKREEAVEKKSGEGAGDKGINTLTKPGKGAPDPFK